MDSQSLETLDIRLREGGAKRRLKGTSKVNTWTDKHTDGHFDLQRVHALKIKKSKLTFKFFAQQFVH